MLEQRTVSCCSRASICYWAVVSLAAWAVLSLIGVLRHWYSLRALGPPTISLAMAIGCFANWARNRTYHCILTGPLFLVAGILFLLSDLGFVFIVPHLVWLFLLVGVVTAFVLEWRYARHSAGSR